MTAWWTKQRKRCREKTFNTRNGICVQEVIKPQLLCRQQSQHRVLIRPQAHKGVISSPQVNLSSEELIPHSTAVLYQHFGELVALVSLLRRGKDP